MLNIYLQGSVDMNNVQLLNDLWFDVHVNSMVFDAFSKGLIKAVDNVDYVFKFKIKSKYNDCVYSIKQLSTGCKTLLNIYMFKDKIFTLSDCGDNATAKLFDMTRGNVYLDSFIIVPDSLDHYILVHTPEKIIQCKSVDKIQAIFMERFS